MPGQGPADKPPAPAKDRKPRPGDEKPKSDGDIDESVEETFPASDPPSFTPTKPGH
jgi:hypothetical protein